MIASNLFCIREVSLHTCMYILMYSTVFMCIIIYFMFLFHLTIFKMTVKYSYVLFSLLATKAQKVTGDDTISTRVQQEVTP